MIDFGMVSYLILWVLVLLLASVAVMLCRQVGLLYSRIGPVGARMTEQGPPIGQPGPLLEVTDIDGSPLLFGTTSSRSTLLVFLSLDCDICHELAPAIRGIWRRHRDRLDVICVIVKGAEPLVRTFMDKTNLLDIPFVTTSLVRSKYQIEGAPYAVLMDKSGIVVAKGIFNDNAHLESIVNAGDLGYASIQSFASAPAHSVVTLGNSK